MLELKNVNAGYEFLQILWDVSFEIQKGEFVALLGSNGAGKTSTLRVIAGFIKPQFGQVRFKGVPIDHLPPYKISQLGLGYVSESLNLFTNMSVHENLLLGAYTVQDRKKVLRSLEFVYHLFPRLKERERQLAGTMSGGERKMLAIGRSLMLDPEMLLVDEPSLGLAPHLTRDVFQALLTLRNQGMTILLVEQNVHLTLKVTDRAYILEHGRIVLKGSSNDLRDNDHVRNAYLGI